MNKNILLMTDVYKCGHLQQYKPGTNKIYSYLIARSDKKIPYTCFFGLQILMQEYLTQPITQEMVYEFLKIRSELLGPNPIDIIEKMNSLAKLGYLPLKIKAVEEGIVMPVKNVLMTITNTLPEFYWVVGFFESLILKVWNTTTVASYSMKLKKLVDKYNLNTTGSTAFSDWQVHDFGYRGCSSEETAAMSGAAHLINFRGTDTIPAVKLLKDIYSATGLIGSSVPASEHSVMCSFGRENELDAFKNMLSLYPSGIVSIVSDTYNLWNVLTNFTDILREDILSRDGKVVFRPDSGNPEKILCGDKLASKGSPQFKGALKILDEKFGSTINKQGFKELNPKVGLIYGDGMYFERVEKILNNLQEMGYATTNIIFGIGGLLLQNHSRDDMGFAIKATYSEVNGISQELEKDPITDSKKKSHKGLIQLIKKNNEFITIDQQQTEDGGLLQTVFENGKIIKSYTLNQIRENATKKI